MVDTGSSWDTPYGKYVLSFLLAIIPVKVIANAIFYSSLADQASSVHSKPACPVRI